MLQTQTVEASTLALIKTLMSDQKLDDFYLVGGTALSLKLGHRLSIDIDLFIGKDFDSSFLNSHLQSQYGLSDALEIKNGLFGFIDQVKVDFISHQYGLIQPVETIEGIRMLSLQDIGAMKLQAIVQNGTRLKDFVDVYYLLEKIPFALLAKAYAQKYPGVNMQMAQAGLLYQKDIDFSVPIKLLKAEFNWQHIHKRLSQAVINPLSIFKEHSEQIRLNRNKGKRLGF